MFLDQDGQSPKIQLAFRSSEAAKSLGISLSTLDRLSKRGEIPFVRLGSVRIYPCEILQEWLRKQVSFWKE